MHASLSAVTRRHFSAFVACFGGEDGRLGAVLLLRRCRGMLETGSWLRRGSELGFGIGVGLGARLVHAIARSRLALFGSES